jgi:hypothetical protein
LWQQRDDAQAQQPSGGADREEHTEVESQRSSRDADDVERWEAEEGADQDQRPGAAAVGAQALGDPFETVARGARTCCGATPPAQAAGRVARPRAFERQFSGAP